MKTICFTACETESKKAQILRIACSLFDGALHSATHPSVDPAEDVHLFRTTTKRLRALLRLIRPAVARAAFAREDARLKRAAHQLAHLRDRAVAVETLDSLACSAAILRRCGLADSTEPATTKGHRDAMRLAARGIEEARRGFLRLRVEADGWDAVGHGLVKTYEQARRRMKAAFAEPSDGAFHRWRIRVKQLCYQLEWLQAVWPKRFATMLKRLRKLGDTLGSDHDLVVLRERLGETSGTTQRASAITELESCIASRSRHLRKASQSLAAKILRETPRIFCRRCKSRWLEWETRGK